jgi:hypothetical protein
MACPTCGTSVLFGGVKVGNKRYCSKKCYEADEINRVAAQIPNEQVEQLAHELRNGSCPKCKGLGPIDIHKSHSVYSFIIYTKYETRAHLLCKKCATKQQTTDLIGSLLLGWWGIPFGLIITPIQIIRNIISMSQNPGINGPSDDLKQRARLILASNAMGVKS